MRPRVLPVLFALPVLAACSGSSHHPAANVTTPADEIAGLAEKGAAASYSATYAFHQVSPDTTAAVQVWRADPSLRVDVVATGTTATLIVAPAGTYACSISGPKRDCLLVAAPGQPVPKPFDVAPANLFSADLRSLAADSAAYDVKSAPTLPAANGVPAAQCFDVAPRATGATAPVPPGRYCFTSAGLLAAATYPSGNTVRLTASQLTTPAPDQFSPYAKPTPLPS